MLSTNPTVPSAATGDYSVAQKPNQLKRKHTNRARKAAEKAKAQVTASPTLSSTPQVTPSGPPPSVPSPASSSSRSSDIPFRQSLANAKRTAKRRAASPTTYVGPSKRTTSQVLSRGTAIYIDHNAADFAAARGAHMAKRGTAAELGSQSQRQAQYYECPAVDILI